MQFVIEPTFSQTFSIHGNVSTNTKPVKNASVTFIDQSDTSKVISAVTDTSGNYHLSIVTSVKPHSDLPSEFKLEQNYPNPFLSSTSISYKLTEQSNIFVKIYNVLGQVVKEFNVGTQTAGVHGIVWNGLDNFGKRISPGVYFYQLTNINKSQTKKMLFGFGEGTSSLSNITIENANRAVVTMDAFHVESLNYKVKIEETDSTQPRILPDEFYGIVIQRDTTIDFTVNGGKIVFSMTTGATPESGGYTHIYVINPDGSGLKQLTFGAGEENPRWSPDGTRIVFSADSLSTSLGTALWIMNADGFNWYPVKYFPQSSFAQPGDHPDWSPDGKKIAFSWCTHCEYGLMIWDIYVVDLTTGELSQLTYGEGTNGYPIGSNAVPIWSADGAQIFFDSGRDDSTARNVDIYSMNTDGSNVNRVFASAKGSTAIGPFSPNGAELAFVRRDTLSETLFTSTLDGSATVKVTDPPIGRSILSPRWAPNGRQIAFVSGATIGSGATIYIVNVDGTNLRTMPLGNINTLYFDWTDK